MTSSSSSPQAAVPCPSCGTPTTGKFCSECGAPVHGAHCAACRSLLTPGARFCHRCGLAVGSAVPAAFAGAMASAPASFTPAAVQPAATAPNRPNSSLLPWGVAALAFIAVVAILAGQRYGSGNNAPAPEDQERVPLGGGAAGAMRAPDISSLSPRERADRLFDRMMRLEAEGKKDSIAFFAPMAISSYQALGPLDADLRYDLGRVAEISGNASVATAQADSILRESPTHLLGLVLAGRAAALRGDTRAQADFDRRLVAAEPAETQKALPEYVRHRGDIDDALSRARR